MGILKDLQPQKVFKYFEEISEIPRGSCFEEQVAEYCVKFAKTRGLWVYKDDLHNVLIKKEGTNNSEPVIIQGHLDMVWEKNADIKHDFETEGIKLVVEGDNLRAQGTTLGADNGIAIAIMLAVLDDKSLTHPPLECLFTTQEEVGLVGALSFDYSKVSAKQIINLDSEGYGKILVSCAGGINTSIILPIKWTESAIINNETATIKVSGAKGGHSGGDIHLGRANANKILARVLSGLKGKLNYELCEISGGAKDNAIPREAQAVINISNGDIHKVDDILESIQNIIQSEYSGIEENISIKSEITNSKDKVYCADAKEKAINIMMSLPNGVMSMSHEIHGLVESSCNFAVIKSDYDNVKFTVSIRSSVDSRKRYVEGIVQSIANLSNSAYSEKARYPGWQYNANSKLRSIAQDAYVHLEGEQIKIEAIHAGLECGIFAENIKGADIISIGPDMWDIHTPEERISISCVEKIYNYLLEILKRL